MRLKCKYQSIPVMMSNVILSESEESSYHYWSTLRQYPSTRSGQAQYDPDLQSIIL